MTYSLTPETFLQDVASHEIRVLRDDGVYRHIRFKRPDTACMHFDLITWPGCLCYTGDMGTFVFTRLADMFEFFRTDRLSPGDEPLKINRPYWSEKLIAVDGTRHKASATEFSEAKFTQVINDYVTNWLESRGIEKEDADDLRDAVKDEILDRIDTFDESQTFHRANDFSHEVAGQHFHFQDLWEYSFTEYTHSFTWCCYALAWGIQQYDAHKDATAATSPTPELTA